MTMDELVQKYIKLREKRAQLKAEYEAQVAPYEQAQDKIEALMLSRFNEMGIDSVKTASGTAYVATRTSATVADWDTFFDYVKGNDAYELVERRVSKAAVEQFKQAHEDLPPGINWSETRTVNFRRS